jgi:hypothetical protein
MKKITGFLLFSMVLFACKNSNSPETHISMTLPLEGTWALQSATAITKGDTVITDYTKNQQMIKIVNATHFSFLKHDLKNRKDTSFFEAGGGTYTLADSVYTEHLDYCNFREWEGHVFPFTIQINQDTLLQSGIEKLENLGINRLIIEKYVRVK